jgi:hypothetical protein
MLVQTPVQTHDVEMGLLVRANSVTMGTPRTSEFPLRLPRSRTYQPSTYFNIPFRFKFLSPLVMDVEMIACLEVAEMVSSKPAWARNVTTAMVLTKIRVQTNAEPPVYVSGSAILYFSFD